MKLSISELATETLPGVFHAHAWGQDFPENLLEQLIEESKRNRKRKARLCLHPAPNELLQVTYLAFSSPYSDRIHSHPHRVEVLIPVFGQATHSTFNNNGDILSSKLLDGQMARTFSTPVGEWHAVEVLTESFVMVEIGIGPFVSTSTVYL